MGSERELVSRYLAAKEMIESLQREQDDIKTQLWESLHAGMAAPDSTWEYDGVGKVCLVKESVTRRLNRKKLVLQGVTNEQIEASMDESRRKAHLRIERPK